MDLLELLTGGSVKAVSVEQETRATFVSSREERVEMADSEANWLPIETAPRDETRVLVGWADDGHSVVIAFYGPKYSAHGVNYGNSWGHGIGWQHQFHKPPTHWMPLPDPPAPDSQKG